MRISDWSSDVCSSDLIQARKVFVRGGAAVILARWGFDPISVTSGEGNEGYDARRSPDSGTGGTCLGSIRCRLRALADRAGRRVRGNAAAWSMGAEQTGSGPAAAGRSCLPARPVRVHPGASPTGGRTGEGRAVG